MFPVVTVDRARRRLQGQSTCCCPARVAQSCRVRSKCEPRGGDMCEDFSHCHQRDGRSGVSSWTASPIRCGWRAQSLPTSRLSLSAFSHLPALKGFSQSWGFAGYPGQGHGHHSLTSGLTLLCCPDNASHPGTFSWRLTVCPLLS